MSSSIHSKYKEEVGSSLLRLVGPRRTAQYKEEVGSGAQDTRFTSGRHSPLS
jgi:hypothetical protein